MISFENVSKIYQTRHGEVKAIDEISLQIKEGEFTVIRGPSGSGKTTLLFTIGGMLRPTQGQVIVDGKEIYRMNKRARAKFRAEHIGFVFQMFHLVPYLNVMENVMMGSGAAKNRAEPNTAKKLLGRLRMSKREYHKPSELSTGERQRTAIARALLNNPKIILADEPTGNLDSENVAEFVEFMDEFHSRGGTVVVVTHGKMIGEYADRIVHLHEGRIG